MKIGSSVNITRAVDPSVTVLPVADRQFKQLISGPIEISLTTLVRTDENVDWFGEANDSLRDPTRYSGLSESASIVLHLERQGR